MDNYLYSGPPIEPPKSNDDDDFKPPSLIEWILIALSLLLVGSLFHFITH